MFRARRRFSDRRLRFCRNSHKRHIKHKKHKEEQIFFYVPFVLYVPFVANKVLIRRRVEDAQARSAALQVSPALKKHYAALSS